jgi:hypothetical protein
VLAPVEFIGDTLPKGPIVECAVDWIPAGHLGFEFLAERHLDRLGHVSKHPIESHIRKYIFPALGLNASASNIRVRTREERLFTKLIVIVVAIKQDNIEEFPVLVIGNYVQHRLDDLGQVVIR